VLYVTERGVFELTPRGLLLTEIARGIDVERDVLSRMGFRVSVADPLRILSVPLD
jgi:propionate CoA-transferase